jgi:hypothetical protein
MEELNAITRKEKFLAKAAGQDVEVPEPITREEMFLSKIAGGAKVIDLTKYADATGTSFNNIILSLFLTGGGAANAQGGDQFWTDINTDGRVKFVIDASSFDAGVTVECEAKSIIKRNGKTVSIETSFLLHSVEKVMVTLYFGWFDGGTDIIVAVETLNLPS